MSSVTSSFFVIYTVRVLRKHKQVKKKELLTENNIVSLVADVCNLQIFYFQKFFYHICY